MMEKVVRWVVLCGDHASRLSLFGEFEMQSLVS